MGNGDMEQWIWEIPEDEHASDETNMTAEKNDKYYIDRYRLPSALISFRLGRRLRGAFHLRCCCLQSLRSYILSGASRLLRGTALINSSRTRQSPFSTIHYASPARLTFSSFLEVGAAPRLPDHPPPLDTAPPESP